MAGGMSFKLGQKGPKLAFGLKGPSSASRPQAAFAPDSDDEEAAQQAPKRHKPAEASGPDASAAPAPLTPDELKTAEKLAEFVAKHGRSFEEVTKQRNTQTGPFSFLFDKDSPGYQYYEEKLREHTAGASNGFLSSTPIPPAPAAQAPTAPAAQAPLPQVPWRHGTLAAGPVNAEATRPLVSDPPVAVQARPSTPKDSLAAMEAFTRLAAKRDEDRGELEAKTPLLNETSFDRRRTMAVYKQDGTRGHHMGDYIPPEELSKFLSKSGSKEAQAQAEALEAASRIQSDNVGHRLLSQMGWREGEGLGARGAGVAAPVAAGGDFGAEKRGLGSEDHTAPKEGDDEFEAYRKRMMLGYKHRPNPLGNPRKAYY